MRLDLGFKTRVRQPPNRPRSKNTTKTLKPDFRPQKSVCEGDFTSKTLVKSPSEPVFSHFSKVKIWLQCFGCIF